MDKIVVRSVVMAPDVLKFAQQTIQRNLERLNSEKEAAIEMKNLTSQA
jgi:hypothetical protein